MLANGENHVIPTQWDTVQLLKRSLLCTVAEKSLGSNVQDLVKNSSLRTV
jgi:hypothetical protein